MKNIGLTLLAILGLNLGLLSHAEAAEAKDKKAATATSVQTAKIDPAASQLKWIGKKVTGQHNGAILVKDGQIELAKGTIVGGVVNIDMASLTVEDLKDPKSNGNLTGHLKSADFFGVENHPISTFKITKVAPAAAGQTAATHDVTGDLTIKGITHPLSFPAKITIDQGNVKAEATGIKVDRTLYDIRYGSGKFFENLGDKTINDHFWIDLLIVTKKS